MKDIFKFFQNNYDEKDVRMVKSPLRICPLGAHVDHQGGVVTGMALDSNVEMMYVPRNDGYIRVQSLDFPDEEYFHMDRVPEMLPGFWGNYLRGAVLSLQQDQILKNGFHAVISGKIPIGGLSSSAAVTTAYLMALCDVNNLIVTKTDLVQFSHWVETEFIGLKNGILDQSANILSENNHLMAMDCKTGEHQLIKKSPSMPEFEVVVVYSGVSKALIGTDYNNRVEECKVGGWILQELAGKEIVPFNEVQLSDIPVDIYNQYREQVPGRFKRRLDHYFTEQDRVQQGMEAWANGDLERFGQLMFESGDSSVYQYESGCPELITIFETLKECEGVYGARFSGAGYRGCCIGLIDPRYKEEIKSRMDSVYPIMHPKYKDDYKVHFCKTNDGARIVSNVKESLVL
ncbi:galactokinase family protein [Evansella sp. AB-P1]|uniref:GHMP family kinase ATP-binding protein n=1 Tax=Evansella sp. AB-P1 TaxID=3037653 RepID=UPI00242015CE|nr:galactokinase family protein [Evansella sp. AB-P1]MDG5789309.1 galactokinase family protein [Evansella sp. AB-P1]